MAKQDNLRQLNRFRVKEETGYGLELYLIRYYESLNFKRLSKAEEAFVHRNYKPRYDEGCIFMSRPLYE